MKLQLVALLALVVVGCSAWNYGGKSPADEVGKGFGDALGNKPDPKKLSGKNLIKFINKSGKWKVPNFY
jgi:hypothetical protein